MLFPAYDVIFLPEIVKVNVSIVIVYLKELFQEV